MKEEEIKKEAAEYKKNWKRGMDKKDRDYGRMIRKARKEAGVPTRNRGKNK